MQSYCADSSLDVSKAKCCRNASIKTLLKEVQGREQECKMYTHKRKMQASKACRRCQNQNKERVETNWKIWQIS